MSSFSDAGRSLEATFARGVSGMPAGLLAVMAQLGEKAERFGSDGPKRARRMARKGLGRHSVDGGGFILACLAVLATLPALFNVDPSVAMAVGVLQLAAIVARARLSMFSLLPALLTFCLFQQYAAVSGWDVYGLLALRIVPWYFDELKICTYAFNLIALGLTNLTGCLEAERRLLRMRVELRPETVVVLLTFAIAVALLIFPSLPGSFALAGESRFDRGILPFVGWSVIPFFFVGVAGATRHLPRAVLACGVFVIVWYASHGERVEALGFIALLAIRHFQRSDDPGRALVRIAGLLAVVVPAFLLVGSLRTGGEALSFEKLVQSMFIQSTACDVTYVFNCAVDLHRKGVQLEGLTYLSYLVNCIPKLDDPFNFERVIQVFYPTAGGALFFAEPVANFGPGFAIVLSAILEGGFALLVMVRSRVSVCVYAILGIVSFRTAWYGLAYPIVTILYFVPFVFALDMLFDIVREREKQRERRSPEGEGAANG